MKLNKLLVDSMTMTVPSEFPGMNDMAVVYMDT